MADIPWWNTGYPFRRELVIDPLVADPLRAGNPVSFTWTKTSTIGQNKIGGNFNNIEILYTSDLGQTWTILGRKIDDRDDDFTISFNAVADISEVNESHYFAYFGNFFLAAIPTRPSYNDFDWPISIPSDGNGITYVHPGQEWISGVSSVTGAQAAFTFYGSKIHVLSQLNPSAGIIRFQLDREPPLDVSLFSSTVVNDEEVFVDTELTTSLHILKMTCTGNKSAPALANKVNISKVEYQRYVKVTDKGEELLPDLAWSSAVVGS